MQCFNTWKRLHRLTYTYTRDIGVSIHTFQMALTRASPERHPVGQFVRNVKVDNPRARLKTEPTTFEEIYHYHAPIHKRQRLKLPKKKNPVQRKRRGNKRKKKRAKK